jgi:hypothetical protein
MPYKFYEVPVTAELTNDGVEIDGDVIIETDYFLDDDRFDGAKYLESSSITLSGRLFGGMMAGMKRLVFEADSAPDEEWWLPDQNRTFLAEVYTNYLDSDLEFVGRLLRADNGSSSFKCRWGPWVRSLSGGSVMISNGQPTASNNLMQTNMLEEEGWYPAPEEFTDWLSDLPFVEAEGSSGQETYKSELKDFTFVVSESGMTVDNIVVDVDGHNQRIDSLNPQHESFVMEILRTDRSEPPTTWNI